MADAGIDPFAGQPDPFAAMVAADSGSAVARAAPVVAGGDPFAGKPDPFAAMKAEEDAKPPYPGATAGTLAENFGTGANSFVAHVLGAPVDFGRFLLNNNPADLLPGPKSPLPKIAPDTIGSSAWIAKNVLPQPVAPQNEIERLAQGAGAGAASAVLPLGAVGALGRQALAAAEPLIGAATPAGAAVNAGIGAVSGAGGQAASDAAPEPLKPIAGLVGGLAAPAAALGVGALGVGAVRMAGDFVEPMTAKGPQAIADRTLAAGTLDPAAARSALDDHAANPQGVPGSEPTTFQVTGDMGQGNMERQAETSSPAQFNTRRADQNAARVGVLNELQPTGDPGYIASHIQSQLAQIDADTAKSVNTATQAAQAKAAAVPGQAAPEDYGAGMRAALSDANDVAKAKESALWKAVDPDGSLALPAAPVSTKAKAVAADVGPLAKPMNGEEAAIFDTASKLPPVVPFGDLTDLRSRVSAEMRNQIGPNGNPVSYGRLTQLRGSIEDAISNAVQHKAALEQHQVAQGAMAPEDTMEARVRDWVTQHYAKQDAVAADRVGLSGGPAAGNTGAAGSLGAAGQTRGRLGGNAGPAGIPSQALSPNIDEAAAARLSAASDATKARAQTFKQGAVGQTLATQGTKDNFRILDSSVGQKFWKPGPTGAEAVRTLTDASPHAVNDLTGYAGLSLRKAALKEDGTIDPGKFASWQKAHGEALRGLAEVAPDVAAKFTNAATAGEAVADATAARTAALDGYQKSSLGKFLKVSDSEDVTTTVGKIFGKDDAIAQMRKLSQSVASNPDARDGLRKSIADYMTSKFVSNREAGTSGVNAMKGDAFQTFVRENRPVLGQVFKPEEIKGMEAVAADIARSNRSIDAVKLPGRSNTPQDLIKELQKGGTAHLSPFAEMLAAIAAGYELGGGTAGSVLGGVKGAVLGGGAAYAKGVVTSMRAAGMAKASDLVNGMLLHPDLARAALERVPEAGRQSSWSRFRQQLNRVATINANRLVTGGAASGF